MRALVSLLLCTALILPITVSSQAPTLEETYAAVFVRLAMGNVSRFTPCIEAHRPALEAAKDRIRAVRVTITPEGRVGAVVATPRNVLPQAALSCFLTIVRTWPVPPPANGRPLNLRFQRSHFVM